MPGSTYSVIKNKYRQKDVQSSSLQKDQDDLGEPYMGFLSTRENSQPILFILQCLTLGLTIDGLAFDLGGWNTPKTDLSDFHKKARSTSPSDRPSSTTPGVIEVVEEAGVLPVSPAPCFCQALRLQVIRRSLKERGFVRGGWSLCLQERQINLHPRSTTLGGRSYLCGVLEEILILAQPLR